MSVPMSLEDLQKLRAFIDFVSANPTILNKPELDFVKKFVEKFGGKVPEGEFKIPAGGKCPFSGDAGKQKEPAADEPESEESESEEVEMDFEPESDLELDMDGVIEADTEPPQPMGDSSKTPTDEEMDKASDFRAQAAAAYSEQKFQEAIDLYTKAIELNPGNALFHAKRGQAYLKLKKPNACVRDCDKALELNCDSAAAYKFRGRAHRLLGNWEDAAKDLRQACKLDFDEEADEWLREVQPNAKKIEQHRIKQERKKAEIAIKQREAALRKARKEQEKQKKRQQKQQQSAPGGGFPGFPGGFPGAGAGGAGGFNVGDLLGSLKDPEISAALEDIMQNPANIEKYKSNPKIAQLIDVVKGMSGKGGFPGFPGGFPGAGGGFAASDGEPKTETKVPPKAKPDFSDDGLD